MNCTVYKSSLKNKEGYYLFIENKEEFSRVPSTLLALIGKPEFVLTAELSPAKPLGQADVLEVIGQLQEKGYYLQLPPEEPITEIPQ
ncbi:MAG: YcgL domain-containing protein [Gammaproteobacteria bacterium]